MVRLIAAAFLSAAACLFWKPAQSLEIKVCTLVQAKAPGWDEIPETAVIDPGRLSFKKKVFLESRSEIPVWASSVKRAIQEATGSLNSRDRKSLPRVLDAIKEWMSGSLVEEAEVSGCPADWRSGGQVLAERKGHRFELARAAVALLRAAGIPARPTYAGSPLAYIYVTPRGKSGFWTVWDPFTGGSAGVLPVLWLPLRAEEVSLASVQPKTAFCRSVLEGRRYADRERAATVFEYCAANGEFPDEYDWLPDRGTPDWWEVWTIGVELEPDSKEVSLVFPLPFVKDKGYGTRKHAVWASDPSALKRISRMLSRTDQKLGGIVLSVKVWIESRQVQDDGA